MIILDHASIDPPRHSGYPARRRRRVNSDRNPLRGMASIPVTVVIPAYNRAVVIERAIASVFSQTVAPSSVIVVDDGSTDGTPDLAERAGATVVRSDTNGGAAQARNRGILEATTPWIAFLDSDDEWLPHHLQTLWPYTERYKLVSGGRVASYRRTRFRFTRPPRTTELRSPAQLIFPDNPISIGAVLAYRAVLRRTGGFDVNIRISEDLDLWLRIVADHPAILVRVPVYVYHHHPGQKTSNVAETRAAQLALLEAFRGSDWWSDLTFRRRAELNRAEAAIWSGAKSVALRQVLRGVGREPDVYWPVARVLARNSVAGRVARITTALRAPGA